MEPSTIIVSTLALGAATGLQSVAEKAVKDSYEAIKTFISSKYPEVGIEQIEKKPDSTIRQAVLEEEIIDSEVDKDKEVLKQVKALLEAIKKLSESEVPVIGVNLKDIKAAALKIEDIISTGTGVNVERSEFTSDIEIKQVRAGLKVDVNQKKS